MTSSSSYQWNGMEHVLRTLGLIACRQDNQSFLRLPPGPGHSFSIEHQNPEALDGILQQQNLPSAGSVQGQRLVQCRSLSLTLFGFYSKLDLKSIFSGKPKNQTSWCKEEWKGEKDPIICITCPHYAVLSQSWGGNNQGDQGSISPQIQAPFTSWQFQLGDTSQNISKSGACVTCFMFLLLWIILNPKIVVFGKF